MFRSARTEWSWQDNHLSDDMRVARSGSRAGNAERIECYQMADVSPFTGRRASGLSIGVQFLRSGEVQARIFPWISALGPV